MFNPLFFSTVVVYMLQNTEYRIKPYFAWLFRTKNFKKVMYRRQLDKTRAAQLLRLIVIIGMSLQFFLGSIVFVGLYDTTWYGPLLGVIILATAPYTWAVLIVAPLWLGRVFVAAPKERRLIKESASLFKKHPGHIIVVAGSYGKTSMKELLGTVLSTHKKVAITPANKNVALSHAQFVRTLDGDEDILIIELGEGKPGDVERFCKTIQPDTVFITGIAPAHLDQYDSVEQAAQDIFSAADFVKPQHVFVNGDSNYAQRYIKDGYVVYGHKGIADAKVTNIKQSLDGLQFTFNNKQKFDVKTKILGKHTIGPICAALYIGASYGIDKLSLLNSIANLQPYEHRMQPRYLAGGAFVIDDTYNGNIEGMEAGLALLNDLPAKRRIYVTPGLVDQGNQTDAVHTRLGKAIAQARPDVVVLIKNSVQPIIARALTDADYDGELRIEDDPLYFYTHIDDVTATGDVVLMQNDWPDNYA